MKKLLHRSCVGLLGGLFAVVLFSSFLFLPAVADAQSQYADNWKYLINRDYVNDMAIHEDNIWQGINGGLVVRSLNGPDASRYYHKLNSGLAAAQVFSVALDVQGNVWVGTERGAFRLSVNGVWSTINMDNSPFTVNTVRVVVPDSAGGVWFGTWLGGAYYRDSQNEWTTYSTQNSGIAGNRIYAIAPDGAGGVWFGTDSRGVAYLDKAGVWTVYNAANSPLPTNDVQDILIDTAGSVWFATMSGLASLNRAGQWDIFNLQNSQIPSEIVNSLVLDHNGNVWMGTNGGLACLQDEANGGTFKVYTTANSRLPAAVVRSVSIDTEGTVWAGTLGGGIAGFNPQHFSWRVHRDNTVSLAGRSYLPANTINKILPFPEGSSSGKLWFATGAGVAYYDAANEKWERLNTENKRLPVNQVTSMARNENGNMAFATDGGGLATVSSAGTWQYYNTENSNIPSNNLADVSYAKGGGIWLVTLQGGAAYLSTDGGWTVYDRASGNLPAGDYSLNSVYRDGSGNTWFGTWGGGAVRLNQTGNWSAFKAGTSGIPANDVSRILEDGKGNTWFGTWGGGVVRLDSGGRWDVFNVNNSALPSNVIRDLVLDSRGWLWLATPQGVAYYDGESWHTMRAGVSGLPLNDIWNMAADTFGNVWFSTNENGVAVYNPDGVMTALAKFGDITERQTETIIFFEGKYLDSDVAPVMEDSRLLLPIRPLATALGAALRWDADSGKVELTLADKKVELYINDTKAYIDGVQHTLDVPASIRSGRTMIPVRFVSESLGLNVTWDSVVRAAIVSK